MPIVSTDLVAYAALNMPEDESSINGGGIDLTRRVVFTDLSSPDTIEAVSSNNADTMNLTLTGRNVGGGSLTVTLALTGTVAVPFTGLGTIERFQKAVLASAAAGTITVRRTTGPTTIGTISPGELSFIRIFNNAFSDVSPKNYYEKFFWKNTHGSLSLLSALVQQSADPSAKITHCIANAVNDTATTSNRLTAPSGGNLLAPGTFDDTDKAVPGTDLAAGAAIGVWLKLTLGANDTPLKSTYTAEISGQSV